MRARCVRRVLVPSAALVLTAAGCTSDGEGTPATSPSPQASATSTPSPAQVELALGEPATVTLRGRDGETSEVEVAVTEVTEGRIGHLRQFRLDQQARSSTPYYATVRVRNTGTADLAGRSVVLWGLDSEGTVRPAADVIGSFRRCQNDPLPRRFREGDTATTCLLYLVPDGTTLRAVQYRFDNRPPFSWPVDG